MTDSSMQTFGEWALGAHNARVGDPLWTVRYALASTREAIDWYDSLTIALGNVVNERQNILVQIRRLLLTMLRRARPDTPDRSMHDGPPRAPDADSWA
jgi:hypothetical protein